MIMNKWRDKSYDGLYSFASVYPNAFEFRLQMNDTLLTPIYEDDEFIDGVTEGTIVDHVFKLLWRQYKNFYFRYSNISTINLKTSIFLEELMTNMKQEFILASTENLTGTTTTDTSTTTTTGSNVDKAYETDNTVGVDVAGFLNTQNESENNDTTTTESKNYVDDSRLFIEYTRSIKGFAAGLQKKIDQFQENMMQEMKENVLY